MSKAGFYAWRLRPPSLHATADAALLKRVRTVHASSRQTYGAPRVHADLQGQGERHGRKRIARLTRERPAEGADITYMPTAAGFLCLPVVLDTWSRKPDAERRSEIVGRSMTNHLRAELVLDAMEAAVGQQRPKDVIHHSDQGSQGESRWSSQRP